MKKELGSIKSPHSRKVKERLDLRNERVITIDPITARDFDDALSLTSLPNGNLRLGVHIADVSHYVKEGSALDIEASKRGNSVYLVDRVIPMLPESLSNDVCSLNPDEIRYTYSVIAELSSDLDVVACEIRPTMIKSCRRFTYNEVQDIIDTGEGDEKDLVLSLNRVTTQLRKKRIAAGSINYDTKEVKYILDDTMYPVDVELHETTEATSLVEECMLLANQQVALHLKALSAAWSKQTNDYNPLPFIYRVHDVPKQTALQEALIQLKALGIVYKSGNITPFTINRILEQVKYSPENSVVNQILIKAMPRAIYSAVNVGHFGLGFSDYTHFTSPIRRYSDLLVHRLLREYDAGKYDTKRINSLRRDVGITAAYISQTERTATEAERASTKLAAAIFAKTKLGEVFDGTVSGVVSWGIYVMLDDIYCEGLLHTRALPSDDYWFDEKKLLMTGRKTKQVYSLGMRVRVRIAKVVIDKRQISLEMAEWE